MKCSLENAVLCRISSWFSLFAKVFNRGAGGWRGGGVVPEYQRSINVINGFLPDHIKLIAPCHKKTLAEN